MLGFSACYIYEAPNYLRQFHSHGSWRVLSSSHGFKFPLMIIVALHPNLVF
ncbi:hypothetical protein PVK06_022463 [Gossypium arboreum]|uniref:Uncharacterized protein n=1 Tax=Gossypium arboreum TaxID=29729 RepID=A0ABR0P8L2_GOSAR|nr:hypothetical protein PVK06_022463 [Gossypium arboreum]